MHDIKSAVRSKTVPSLFGDEPKIIAGTLENGDLFVQFWGEGKVVGELRPIEYAGILANDSGVRMLVREGLPADWMPAVWAAYEGATRGEHPEPTHTATWPLGSVAPFLTTVES